jgi:hypothetical protein
MYVVRNYPIRSYLPMFKNAIVEFHENPPRKIKLLQLQKKMHAGLKRVSLLCDKKKHQEIVISPRDILLDYYTGLRRSASTTKWFLRSKQYASLRYAMAVSLQYAMSRFHARSIQNCDWEVHVEGGGRVAQHCYVPLRKLLKPRPPDQVTPREKFLHRGWCTTRAPFSLLRKCYEREYHFHLLSAHVTHTASKLRRARLPAANAYGGRGVKTSQHPSRNN